MIKQAKINFNYNYISTVSPIGSKNDVALTSVSDTKLQVTFTPKTTGRHTLYLTILDKTVGTHEFEVKPGVPSRGKHEQLFQNVSFVVNEQNISVICSIKLFPRKGQKVLDIHYSMLILFIVRSTFRRIQFSYIPE